MRRLAILRHAKAQPDAPNGDHSRHLTSRGERDATSIGKILLEAMDVPDLIVSSDANRTRETAELVATVTGYKHAIVLESSLYLAHQDAILEAILPLSDAAMRVVVVGHNPGLEDLVSKLSAAEQDTGHFPTAGLALFDVDSTTWRNLSPETCRLRLLTAPPRKND